jgi:hypothetical protein
MAVTICGSGAFAHDVCNAVHGMIITASVDFTVEAFAFLSQK